MVTRAPPVVNACLQTIVYSPARAVAAVAASDEPDPSSHSALQQRMAKAWTRNRILLARVVALVADGVQIGLFPLFAGGVAEGADLALEVVTGLLLCWICGFHVAFLPTAIGEALPMLDLFPSWTLATLYVTRGSATAPKALSDSSVAKR